MAKPNNVLFTEFWLFRIVSLVVFKHIALKIPDVRSKKLESLEAGKGRFYEPKELVQL